LGGATRHRRTVTFVVGVWFAIGVF
jgi:hypothetical protein